MSLSDGVATFAGRLATFDEPHHLKKRRSSSVKKRTPATVTWPHQSPSAEDLARAGFYFKPTSTSPDNCMCFVCKRQLDGWEPDDNPFFEHFSHSPECGWAINVCIGQRMQDSDRQEEDPMTERLAAARKATFLGSWPHEGKKGWKCKTKKMVEAGWCFDASPEYDDGVTCFYCNLSLDGWEPKDDPLEEHRKRSPDCYFFALLEEYPASSKPARGKKVRGSTASKASRMSTQSNVTAMSEAPTGMDLDDIPADEDDTVITTATTTSKTGRVKKGMSKAKGALRGGRKTTKSKKTSSLLSEDLPPPVETDVEPDPQPAKRTTRGKANLDSSVIDASTLSESQPATRRGTRTKASKKKAEPRVSDDETQLQSELLAAVEASARLSEDAAEPAPRTRGTKRMSDGTSKLESSVMVLDQAPAFFPHQPAEPKRQQKKPRGKKAAAAPRSSDVTSSETTDVAPKPVPKKKGKKAAKQAEPEPEHEVEETDLVMPDVEPPREPTPPPVRFPTPVKADHVPTPTPSPQSSDAENQPPSTRPSLKSQPPLSLDQHPRPSLNPQGRRVPLAETSPRAQNAPTSPTNRVILNSPSKRNIIEGGLVSSLPWEPIDLENIFVQSPETKKLLGSNVDPFLSIDAAREKESVGELVKMVKAVLTSPEKKMSVQQWVEFNAQRGEERLREECGRLVGLFETEGGKAMRVLEGVECKDVGVTF